MFASLGHWVTGSLGVVLLGLSGAVQGALPLSCPDIPELPAGTQLPIWSFSHRLSQGCCGVVRHNMEQQGWQGAEALLIDPVYSGYPDPPISDPQFHGHLRAQDFTPGVALGKDPNDASHPYWDYWDERFQKRFDANVRYDARVYCPWTSPAGMYLKVCDRSTGNLWPEMLCVPIVGLEDELGNNGPPGCPVDGGTNPIHTLTGNKYQALEVYRDSGPFPLNLTLHYNSRAGGMRPDIPMGWNMPQMGGARWTHTHAPRVLLSNFRSLVERPEILTRRRVPEWLSVRLRRPEGRVELHTNGYDYRLRNTVQANWQAAPNITGRLESLSDAASVWAGLRYTDAQDTVELYDLAGKLLRVTNRQGLSHHYSYNGNQTLISDDFGRTLTLTKTDTQLQVTAPDGSQYRVDYNTDGDVVAVVNPDGSQRTLGYTDSRFPGSLTTLTDETGVVVGRWSYDAQNRAVSSEHAGGSERYTLSYQSSPGFGMDQRPTTITDPLGQSRVYQFVVHSGRVNVTGISGGACPHCGANTSAIGHDANGFVNRRTDWNGVTTSYTRDAQNRILSQTEAVGTPQARTTTTTWHPQYHLPLRTETPGKITEFSYDNAGNLLERRETDTATNDVRTTRYTYNAYGQILTEDGPRTDVSDLTRFTYYPSTDACVGCRGQLKSQTNALGHSTHYTAYNGRGQLLSSTAPNGTVTTLAYDLHGRLLSQTVNTDVTTYVYDLAGRLLSQTQPDGTTQTQAYDAQNRLTEVRDSAGNSTRMTYNALGAILTTEQRDATGTVTARQTQAYDSQGRLSSSTDGLGRSSQYQYDPQGNLRGTTDPQGRTTTHGYDPLNRRSQDQDPLGGILSYGYDSQDNLLRITDPRGLSTHYDPNSWGEVRQQDSPDTRSTVQQHDPAGNVLSSTDARGVSVSHGYDALNRRSSSRYPDRQTSYRYDRTTNGKGQLTELQDSSGSQSFTYNKRGQVTQQRISLNGLPSLTVGYGYGKGGRLTRVTYPSGRTVNTSYRTDGTLSQVRTSYGGTTQTVVSQLIWNPGGQLTKLRAGNALVEQRSYDLAGQLTQLNRVGVGKLGYTYDLAGNITQLGNERYGYDSLDRLIQAQGIAPRSYSYDANGNRTASDASPYVLAPDSNRLLQGAGRVYDYDASGNPLSDGRYSYSYDSQGRLSAVMQGATVRQRNTYNTLGQRVRKEASAGSETVTHYLYGTEGQLLAELDGSGNTRREYLYLQSWPVAVVDYPTPVAPVAADELPEALSDTVEEFPEAAESPGVDSPASTEKPVPTTRPPASADGRAVTTTPVMTYLHPDHLGTPRLATDSAKP